MIAIFECVAQAVKDKGLRGLCDFVPGGSYILDVADDAFRMIREKRKANQLRADLEAVALASTEEARKTAEEVARRVMASANPEERITLELYLTQIPGAIRQSLKRPNDPSGKSVPSDFAVNSPADFARLLPARAPHFRPGADLPQRTGWKLEELLGAGGFGEVWLARHSFLPHPRAVKFCTDPLVRTKLTAHEGKVIARVMEHGNHPNVVPLLDAVLDGETPWLMYEYVGGGCLTDLIHAWQSLPATEREAVAVAALCVLAATAGHFHRLTPSIVHRDLKPANVLVAADSYSPAFTTGSSAIRPGVNAGLSGALRITDFGIGGVAVEYMRQQTSTGISVMAMMSGFLETSLRGSYTPVYASPQQRNGNTPDPRDDVHALGVIAFHMMTGRMHESPGSDVGEDLQDVGASAGFIAIVTKCVASKPERRPKDAVELAEKFAELKTGKPSVASAPSVASVQPVRTSAQSQSKPAAPKAPATQVKPTLTPMEGGSPTVTTVTASAATATTRWLIPLRGEWFTRPANMPEADWTLSKAKLPGEISTSPNETYRLKLSPDATTDAALEKLRSLVGLVGLEALDLTGCHLLTDAGLMHLGQLRGLKALSLTDTKVSDSGLTLLLTRFPTIEALGLGGAGNLTRSSIRYLKNLRNLKALALPPAADTGDVRREFAKIRPACNLA